MRDDQSIPVCNQHKASGSYLDPATVFLNQQHAKGIFSKKISGKYDNATAGSICKPTIDSPWTGTDEQMLLFLSG